MVLIIGNRHIKSRVRNKFQGYFFESVQRDKQLNSIAGSNTNSLAIMSLATVLGVLFLYSVAMFTLPFIAFFGVQYYMLNQYHFDRFTSNCYAVLAAVIVVNSIIAVYVYRAMTEADDPSEKDESHDEHKTPDENKSHPKTD